MCVFVLLLILLASNNKSSLESRSFILIPEKIVEYM